MPRLHFVPFPTFPISETRLSKCSKSCAGVLVCCCSELALIVSDFLSDLAIGQRFNKGLLLTFAVIGIGIYLYVHITLQTMINERGPRAVADMIDDWIETQYKWVKTWR